VRGIHETGADRHVYRVGAWPIIGAVFRFAVQVKAWPIAPSAYNGLASFVDYSFIGQDRLLNLGKSEAVALLNIEHRMVGENKGCAALRLVGLLVVFLLAVGQLLIENDLRTLLALANTAI